VRIVAHDNASRMSFTISGTPHAGRVAMHFVNRGHVAHEVDLAQMKKGVHLRDVRAALHSPDGEAAAPKLLVHPERSITAPDLLSPGMAETVYAPLHAGRYVVVCFLPGPDGMPHVLMGMLSALRVLPAAGRVAPPHGRASRPTRRSITARLRSSAGSAIFAELTDREREVLELVARGRNNTEIARALFISGKTVRDHVSNVFAKLQVADRAQAIVRAREAGLG